MGSNSEFDIEQGTGTGERSKHHTKEKYSHLWITAHIISFLLIASRYVRRKKKICCCFTRNLFGKLFVATLILFALLLGAVVIFSFTQEHFHVKSVVASKETFLQKTPNEEKGKIHTFYLQQQIQKELEKRHLIQLQRQRLADLEQQHLLNEKREQMLQKMQMQKLAAEKRERKLKLKEVALREEEEFDSFLKDIEKAY